MADATHDPGTNQTRPSEMSPGELFPGLSEKQVEILYREAPIQKLGDQQTLFVQDAEDDTLYIVLQGRLGLRRAIHDATIATGTAAAGDWLLPRDYSWDGCRTATCLAQESATIMALNSSFRDSLDPDLKAGIYKIMYAKAQARANQRGFAAQKAEKQAGLLQQALFNARGRRNPQVMESPVVQQIIANIPRLPAAATNLATKLMDANLPASEATELVKRDPALTGIILKTINSSFYSFQQKISDVNHAIVLLGFTEVYQMVMGDSLLKTMPDTPDFRRLYVESLIVSQIAFAIAHRAHAAKPAEAATIGLMSNIGWVVLGLLKKQNPKLGFLVDQLDHAQMGATLLQNWNLPEVIWRSIDYQEYPHYALPAKVPEEVTAHVAMIALARHCSRLMYRPGTAIAPPIYWREYAQVINWDKMEPAAMIDREIVPGLQQRRKQLPVPVNDLLERYLKETGPGAG